VAAFGVPIGGLLTAWLYRLFNLAGIQAADGLRTKLQEIIVNGLNAGAKNVAEQSEGKGQVEIKNAVVAQAVTYAQDHAADTLKQLGLDPQSGAAVEAIKARIETAINDPASPTPPVLDAPGVAAKAA
jgi:esterase/lipase